MSAALSHIPETLPGWAAGLLNYFDLTDLGAVQERISAVLTEGGQVIAAQALAIGQNTVQLVVSFFVMLYLLFFLLRDGDALARRIRDAVPLYTAQQNALFRQFAIVIRATVKGSIVVAVVQGALGGVIFWVLGIEGALLVGGRDDGFVAGAGRGRRPGMGTGKSLPAGHGGHLARDHPDHLRCARHQHGRQCPAADPGRRPDQDPGLHRAARHHLAASRYSASTGWLLGRSLPRCFLPPGTCFQKSGR